MDQEPSPAPSHEGPPPGPHKGPPTGDCVESSLPEFDSADLLQGGNEVLIRHAGEVYRLRLTRNDKLILQK
ncbi:MAG: hemin uptake protein HemP [Planctomycetes bacterium]|nr:hemin uptake protein HemP [Planctomycetota bacterium]